MIASTASNVSVLDTSRTLDGSQRVLAAKVGQVIALRPKQASSNEPSVLLSIQNVGTKRSQRAIALEREARKDDALTLQESSLSSDSSGGSGGYENTESTPTVSNELIRDNQDAEQILLQTRKRILSEANAAMMAQAQALPRIMLSLLG